jgi:DNA-directed RNA polymerase beta' subunit
MGKQHVIMRRLNWDVQFYKDLLVGNGFQIIEPSGVSIDGMKKKSMYGANSPLYGTNYEDEQAFIERYRCSCGEFVGRQFEGEECPICHTKVEYKSSNINITGWISLGTSRIINPYYFNVLQNAIGKNVFLEMIFAKYIVTTDGMRTKLSADKLETEPLSKYSYIGIDEFFNNFEEIIEYFKAKKKNKVDTFDLLLNQKRAVFTSHIPVYSTMLRPQSVTSDTFYFGGIDKIINTLYSLSEYLKNCVDIEEDYILQRIQTKVNKMWDMNLEMINGKEGWIRQELLGGSINYSSRNVILPDPTLHDNEIDISYNTFLELFKYKIIYYLMKLDNTSLSRAYDEWKNAFMYDEKVYQVMCFVLEKEQPRLIINRNPTLNYYSMLLMKIRTIKKDVTDYTLSIPLSILPGLNADFDGDK